MLILLWFQLLGTIFDNWIILVVIILLFVIAMLMCILLILVHRFPNFLIILEYVLSNNFILVNLIWFKYVTLFLFPELLIFPDTLLLIETILNLEILNFVLIFMDTVDNILVVENVLILFPCSNDDIKTVLMLLIKQDSSFFAFHFIPILGISVLMNPVLFPLNNHFVIFNMLLVWITEMTNKINILITYWRLSGKSELTFIVCLGAAIKSKKKIHIFFIPAALKHLKVSSHRFEGSNRWFSFHFISFHFISLHFICIRRSVYTFS